jgi:hypothetical protein
VGLQDYISELYVKLGLDYRANLRAGQICQTPVCYTHENAEIWRPIAFDSSQTNATAFAVIAKPGNTYKEARVIHKPQLSAYEEFPVVKAKTRPVVILSIPPGAVGLQRDRMKLDKALCIVAPCYGLTDEYGNLKIPSGTLERISNLEFPQFFHLPKAVPFDKESLLRLDSVFHSFLAHLEPTQWALSEPALEIVRSQVQSLISGTIGGAFKEVRDILLA